jgi:tetratricopeptide (TPR) repeat protein
MSDPLRSPCATALEHLEEGKQRAKNKNLDAAIHSFDDAIKVADEGIRCPKRGHQVPFDVYFEALHERALAFAQRKKYTQAVQDFDQIIQGPEWVETVSQKNVSVQEEKEEILKRLNHRIIDAYFQRGQIALDQGKYFDAKEDLTQAINRGSKSFLAYFLRGTTCRHIGDDPQADEDFQKAKEINPGMWEALKPAQSNLPTPIACITLHGRFGKTQVETHPSPAP